MLLNQLIEKYVNNVLVGYNSLDFKNKTKYINKNNKIIDDIYLNHLEDEFFNEMFKSNIPFVLGDIAITSFSRKYDVIKSYEIIKYLKTNADKIIFSSDININNKTKYYYQTLDLSVYKNETSFYKKFPNNELYLLFYKYIEIINNQYHYYINNNYINNKSYKSWEEDIDELIQSLDKKYLNKFFELTKEKYILRYNYNDMAINTYYVYKYTNDLKYALKTYKYILNLGDDIVTPKLKELINDYLKLIK